MNSVISKAPANASQLKPLFLGYQEHHAGERFVSQGKKRTFGKAVRCLKHYFWMSLWVFNVQNVVYQS